MSNNEQIGQNIRLKYLFTKRIGGAWGQELEGEEGTVCLRAADIETEKITHNIYDLTRRVFSQDEISKKGLHQGDLIIEKSGGGENQPVGRIALFQLNEPALCSNFMELLRPNIKKVLPQFVAFLLYSLWLNRAVVPSIKQTTGIQNLDITDYFDNKIFLPSISIQKRIVSYLESELCYLDNLIAQKKQLISLLSEKRQALITRAVTRGIDPNVKLKNSGIDWLGDVPEHWEIKKVKYVVDKIDKAVDESDFIIAVENIESKTGKLVGLDKVNNYKGSLSGFNKGDVIFNKLRPYLAKVYLAESQGACVGELLVLRAKQMIYPHFLFYRFLSPDFISEVDSSTVGTKMPRANWDDFIKHLKIGIPSYQEQVEIIEWLDKKLIKINELIYFTQHSVELLKERRTVLISAAVTGQIEINT